MNGKRVVGATILKSMPLAPIPICLPPSTSIMLLDLRTLYVLTGLTCAGLGLLLLAAFATRRFAGWLGWWGVSNLLVGIGTFLIPFRGAIPLVFAVSAANLCNLTGAMVLVVSVRMLSGHTGRAWSLLAMGALWLLTVLALGTDLDTVPVRIAIASFGMAACDMLIAREGWRINVKEKLAAARIVMAMFGATSLMYVARAALALAGERVSPVNTPGAGDTHEWLVAFAAILVVLRSVALLLLSSERTHRRLLLASRTDALTGVWNRTGLAAALRKQAIGKARVSVLAIDLDHLKAVNDGSGHHVGDQLLLTLAAATREVLHDGAVIARLGGDEFVAIVGDPNTRVASELACCIQAEFARGIPAGLRTTPTLSIGIAAACLRSHAFDDVMRRADIALYEAKKQGRNRIVVDGLSAMTTGREATERRYASS